MAKFKLSFWMVLGTFEKTFLFTAVFASIIDFFFFKHTGISLLFGRKEIIILGIIFSVICFFILPLFDVGKYLQTQNIKIINDYKRKYKIDFVFLVFGFIGLACWNVSINIFDVWGIIGSIFILFFVSWAIYLTYIVLKE